MEICSIAKLVFGLNQSLDGYVDHQEFAPGPSLFRHFTEQVRDLAGSVYGRRMYEVMRYWDEDRPEWDAIEHDFAAVWRGRRGRGAPSPLEGGRGGAKPSRDKTPTLSAPADGADRAAESPGRPPSGAAPAPH